MSDPHARDSDGDGVQDADERRRGTDASDPDTDGDGLLDGHNVTVAADSATARAWRSRGILEGPAGTFWGELDQCLGLGGLKADEWSSDRPLPDKLGDGDELRGWSVAARGERRHVASDPCAPDEDRDGLPDDQEKALGSDPWSPDTDGDGVRDAIDADPLHDLGLLFSNVTLSTNATRPLVQLAAGAFAASAAPPASRSAALEVDDGSPSRDSLVVAVLVSVVDDSGAHLRFFGDARGSALSIDVVKGTLDGEPLGTLSFHGPDGALSFDASVTRA